ncbi:Crp/Fnr family transcriptional regulator [Oceanobacillus halotolerans]|uniref:Crp/Fnr family transcriptional regulator n=1 Tax=Oceanobacillus halotolerans TaxID=2663380 RepID=UPI0013D8E1C3|nr:Crp/Fnr family transcriptional regulator [Oceanobacillus halotolerans]
MEPLLQRLAPHEYDIIIANAKRKNVDKGDFVFKEGETSEYLYFIHRGEVRIFKNMGTNKEITIFTRKEQDSFGEIGIFSGGKYSNSAQATKHGILYYIHRDQMEAILAQNGKLALRFIQWVSESLEASKAKMRDFVAFGSEGAVASVFIRFSNMYGIVTTEGVRLTEPLMIRDISKHIGISRETVSRIVNKWKDQGIVENDNKYFLIKNMEYFRELLVCKNCGVENCVL